MCTSPAIADAVREYLTERIWSQTAGGQDVWRALCAAQLMGLAWVRYVLRVEPLASDDVDTVAALVGPTIDGYMERASAPDSNSFQEVLDLAGGRAAGRAPLAKSVRAVRSDRDGR